MHIAYSLGWDISDSKKNQIFFEILETGLDYLLGHTCPIMFHLLPVNAEMKKLLQFQGELWLQNTVVARSGGMWQDQGVKKHRM